MTGYPLLPHFNIKKNGLKALNILNVIGNTEWGADRKDYGCIMYESARKSYLQRRCLGAFRTSIESLYFDEDKPSLGARRADLYLQYASTVTSLPKHSTHDKVFDKYMKLFDARPNAIRTFGLSIKQFLTASNIDFSRKNYSLPSKYIGVINTHFRVSKLYNL